MSNVCVTVKIQTDNPSTFKLLVEFVTENRSITPVCQ